MKSYLLLFAAFILLETTNVFSQTVCITENGQHYHTASCKNVSKKSTRIDLASAQRQGYTPCNICHPPTGAAKPKTTSKKQPAKKKTSSSPAKSTKPAQSKPTANQ